MLRGIAVGYFGWLLALVGPIGCLILCEACKIITAYQMKSYQAKLALAKAAEDHMAASMPTDDEFFGGKKAPDGKVPDVADAAGAASFSGGVVPTKAASFKDGQKKRRCNGRGSNFVEFVCSCFGLSGQVQMMCHGPQGAGSKV